MSQSEKLRHIPSVHEVVERLQPKLPQFPRSLIVDEVRRALAGLRSEIAAGREPFELEKNVCAALASLETPPLRPVINATGVVLHTNLGRAPLGPAILLGGYSNLEYDLSAGKRGKRDTHTAGLFERLLGAPGIVVNNNAAAIFLALHELAHGGEVVVSRGELIEIGDGFRIPEIMSHSGAVLREVGTTNRTRIDDYRNAINERTRLLLRVHPSNFHISGFTERPQLQQLADLGRERGLPVYEDLGSGCVADLRPFGVDEPLASESLRAGVDLVSFSGDKLLGGPQAGILAGKAEIVTRLRRNPMFRALRVDKMTYQLLGQTLRNVLMERWSEIPALAMIRQSAAGIRARAEALAARVPHLAARIVAGQSVIGGGATPEQSIPTWLLAIEGDPLQYERQLRSGQPPVLARIEDDRLLLDLRTVFPHEEADLETALSALLPQARSR